MGKTVEKGAKKRNGGDLEGSERTREMLLGSSHKYPRDAEFTETIGRNPGQVAP